MTPEAIHDTDPPGAPAPLTVRANGLRLAYRVWGTEHGTPPVVLVHGRTADSLDWAAVAAALANRRHVLALDLSGHGRSDWPGRYSLPGFRDDLGGFLTALGLTGADIVAHSMGGFAATLLAEDAPGLVGRLVLEESPPLLPLDPPRPPAERPAGPLGFDWAVVPAVDEALNAPDPAWYEGLARIAAPTLVVAGGPSSPFPQQGYARQARRIPGARLVTIDAGHLVHARKPRAFLDALAAFGI